MSKTRRRRHISNRRRRVVAAAGAGLAAVSLLSAVYFANCVGSASANTSGTPTAPAFSSAQYLGLEEDVTTSPSSTTLGTIPGEELNPSVVVKPQPINFT